MSSELRVDKIMPIDGIGNDTSHGHGAGNTSVQYGGGIIQVVQSLREGQLEQSFSSATTVMSATITPKFSTSKIYVTMQGGRFGMYSNAGYYSEIQLVRDSTSLTFGSPSHRGSNNNGNAWGQGALSFLDSPATTSQITYKAQVKSSSSSGTVYPTTSGTGLTIVAMEISA